MNILIKSSLFKTLIAIVVALNVLLSLVLYNRVSQYERALSLVVLGNIAHSELISNHQNDHSVHMPNDIKDKFYVQNKDYIIFKDNVNSRLDEIQSVMTDNVATLNDITK